LINKSILLALAPKNSPNSLSIDFVLVVVIVGGEVVVRESLVPRPQGSAILTDRPVPLLAVVWWFPDHGFACVFETVCHGSFVAVVVIAELRPLVSDDHGSSINLKKKKRI